MHCFVFFAEDIDYRGVDEEIIFGPDEVSKGVLIPFTGDDVLPEANKTFEVYLSASPGVFISPNAYVTATILNDDIPVPGLYSYMHTLVYGYNTLPHLHYTAFCLHCID